MGGCLQKYDVPWQQVIRLRYGVKHEIKQVFLPYIADHSLNVFHGMKLGISSAFPIIGRPFGPGGNGKGRVPTRLNHNPSKHKHEDARINWTGPMYPPGVTVQQVLAIPKL